MISLKNETVLITGASSGIGLACAKEFAKHGAKLILLARRLETLNKIAADLHKQFQVEVFPVEADIRNKDEIKLALQKLPENFRSIDLLINNAGVETFDGKFSTITDADIDNMVDTNLKGLLYITKEILPGMINNNKGHIVNIGSIAAHFCYPGGNVYSATKHAVKSISTSLRIDLLGTAIRVSEVDPGSTDTPITIPRWGEQKAKAHYASFAALKAEDIATSVIFCCIQEKHVNIDSLVLSSIDQIEDRFSPRNEPTKH